MTVHNHPPYRPVCNERSVDGQLRGACLNDDGSPVMSADPTAEHIDAVAKVAADYVGAGEYPSDPHGPNCYDVARRCECASDIAADILTSTDAAVHAAMLDALVRAGVLTEERAPIYRGAEHHHWQQRWDGEHTHEGRRFVTPWAVAS